MFDWFGKFTSGTICLGGRMFETYTCHLTLRLLMSYIYGVPILDVSRSHTMTQRSR